MLSVARLSELLEECKSELNSIGIKYGVINKITINTKRKTAYGVCAQKNVRRFENEKVVYDSSFNIEIMKFLNEKRTEKEIKTTIMHEVLHTVKDCFNHSPLWKKYASVVNYKFGYNVQTRTPLSGENLEIAKTEYVANWEVICECCNKKVAEYKRKPTRDFKLLYHPSCGKQSLGKFKLIQK